MCIKKVWPLKVMPTIQETVAEGVNYTVFLGISSEGDYFMMAKEDFSTNTAAFISSSHSLKGFW